MNEQTMVPQCCLQPSHPSDAFYPQSPLWLWVTPFMDITHTD